MKYLFTIMEGIQVEINAATFREAHVLFETVRKEAAVEKIKIIHKPVVKTEKLTLRDRILELKDQKFFLTPKTLREIKDKFTQLAIHYPMTSMPSYINPLVREGLLKRTREMKDGKEVWVYENG